MKFRRRPGRQLVAQLRRACDAGGVVSTITRPASMWAGICDADIRADASEKAWTTHFDEETPPFPFPANAEMFFDVQIEDQVCTSTIMKVPSENHIVPK
jgi:hypothetical protein